MEAERETMRDVRLMWQKVQVVEDRGLRCKDWDVRCQNIIHDAGIRYNTVKHRRVEDTPTRQASGDNYGQVT